MVIMCKYEKEKGVRAAWALTPSREACRLAGAHADQVFLKGVLEGK